MKALAAHIKLRCRYCKRHACTRCDWLAVRPTRTPASAVKVGDTFISPDSKAQTTVLETYRIVGDSAIWIRVQYPGKRKDPPEYTYRRIPEERVYVLRWGRCAAPCCWRCRRHPGPNRHYCRNHWHAEELDVTDLAASEKHDLRRNHETTPAIHRKRRRKRIPGTGETLVAGSVGLTEGNLEA